MKISSLKIYKLLFLLSWILGIYSIIFSNFFRPIFIQPFFTFSIIIGDIFLLSYFSFWIITIYLYKKYKDNDEIKKKIRSKILLQLLLTLILSVLPYIIIYFETLYYKYMPPKAPDDGITRTWEDYNEINSFRECKYFGGNWHTWSYWQEGRKKCDMPYPDGGKLCTDSSDCISQKCLYDYKKTKGFGYYYEGTVDENLVGKEAEGICAQWVSISCVNHSYFVKNGILVYEFCME